MVNFKTKRIINNDDFDTLVNETYGKHYCYQQQNDCRDRGTYYFSVPCEPYDYPREKIPEKINGDVMGVSFAAWLARDIKEWKGKKSDITYLDLFWERNFYPALEMIVNDLYARGLLEAGEYGLRVDW